MEITDTEGGSLYLKCREITTVVFCGERTVPRTKQWPDGEKTTYVAQVAVIHDDGAVTAHLLDRSGPFWQRVKEFGEVKIRSWAWLVHRTGSGRDTRHTALPSRPLTADELMAIAQLTLPEIRGGSDE